MQAPLYQDHQTPHHKPQDAHAGLWFERFFNRYDSQWKLAAEDKQAWIKQTAGQIGDRSSLEKYALRQIALVQNLQGKSQRYHSDWHFITGMGNSHPVENGFSWHPCLAVPYLSGASVKGLLRAWVEMNDEGLTEIEKKARLKSWFGTETKEDIAEQTGDFIFFDALPNEPAELVCDIMTPHAGKWYSEGGKDEACVSHHETVPADWHKPVPVPFLAVKRISLVFHIAPRRAKSQSELAQLMQALTCALDYLGAGAKTAAGYGYFSEDTGFGEQLKAAQVEQQQALQEQQRQDSLSPFEQSLEALLENSQESEHDTRLLTELKAERWQGNEKKIVAEKIKFIMQDSKKWQPDFTGSNKKKLKLKERSLLVQKYIDAGEKDD